MGNSDSFEKARLEDFKKEGTDANKIDISEPENLGNIPEFPYVAQRFSQKIEWEEIVRQGQRDWKDDSFPAGKGIILDPMIRREKRVQNWENFVWKRPREVYGEGNYQLFNDIRPNDIKQGHCGDCYFLSAISSIAENPQRIKDMFLTKEVNNAGIYAVRVYVDGEPREVVVDDRFPFDKFKEQWAFSRTTQNELWVLVLEKVWAKIYGSYQRIEAGDTAEALNALTGAPAASYFHQTYADNLEKLWTMLDQADQRGYIMTTAVATQGMEDGAQIDMSKVGLVDAHAYSLISALEVEIGVMKKTKFLLIRNPWGFREWTGDWSDNSPLWKDTKAEENLKKALLKRNSKIWNQEQINQIFARDSDDGFFWMSFQDYVKFFYMTTICSFDEASKNNYIADIQRNPLLRKRKNQNTPDYGVLHFKTPVDIENGCVLTFNQVNARHMDETMRGNYLYAALKCVLVQLSDRPQKKDQPQLQKDLTFIEGDYYDGSTLHLRINTLQKGEYLLFYQYEWTKHHECQKAIINIYCQYEIKLQRIEESQFNEDFYEQMIEWLKRRMRLGIKYSYNPNGQKK